MITTSTSRTAVVRPIVRIQTHSGTFIGQRLPVTVHQQVAEGLSRLDGRPAPREKTGPTGPLIRVDEDTAWGYSPPCTNSIPESGAQPVTRVDPRHYRASVSVGDVG